MHDSLEQRLYDEYLDAALEGEVEDPDEFCRRHGADAEVLLPWLDGLASLISDEPTTVDEEPLLPADAGLPWERLGEYRLIRRLGEGGMGVVFLAEQSSLRRLVALKVIRPEYVGSPTAITRFAREARAVAQLTHEHVVEIYGYGEDEGVHYLAMELVPGKSLRAILDEASAEGAPIAMSTLVRWCAQVARALACAHDSGIVHRDVKPANIRITRDQRAVLLDFGLAKQLELELPSLTAGFAGSPAYASPEQLHGRRERIDGRTDVYSLGATLYEMLTGRLPYPGSNIEELLDAMRRSEAPPPRRLNAAIPRDLDVVVGKAIEKEIENRYAAEALASDLEAVLELRPIGARPPGVVSRSLKWVRRNPVTAAALATTAVAVLGGIMFFLWRRAEDRREDQRRAADLIASAEVLLGEYDAGREVFEKRKWAAIALRREMTDRRLGARRTRELDDDERDVEIYRLDRERSLAEVFRLIKEAGRFDADAEGLDGVHAAFYYQKWLDVRSTRRAPMADLYADLVEKHDTTGRWVARVRGRMKSTIRTDPPGAEVHVFRYTEIGDLPGRRGRRLIPVAPGPEPPVVPGEVVLRVVHGAGGLRSHDIVLELDAGPLDRGLYVVAGGDRARRHDRLVAVDGRRVDDLESAARVLESGAEEGSGHLFTFASGERRYSVEGASLGALGIEVADVEGAVKRGGMGALLWRDGELERTELPEGLVVRRTAAPMFLSPRSLVGITPIDGLTLDAGWYGAVARLDGHEDQILAFHVDYADDPFHKGGHADLDATLLPHGTTEEGWVYIACDALFSRAPSFWIMEREVTCGEYLEFLNDPETLRELAERGGRIPRRPTPSGQVPTWPRDGDGRFRLASTSDALRPVTGVSWFDAEAFAAWMDRRHPRWTHDLPDHDQWVRSGKGGDSRTYVFGDHFRQSWAGSRFSRRRSDLGAARSHVIDESPFGVFDLTGSVTEWARGPNDEDDGALRIHFGGSFLDSDPAHFRIGDYRLDPPRSVRDDTGFRLIRQRRKRSDDGR